MWTITALVSFALVFQFGILVEGQNPAASVDCGDHGNDMTIRIEDVPDLSEWSGQEAAWRLNNNSHSDCLPSFSIGASNNVTYGPFDADNCSTVTITPDYVFYEFLINAQPSSPARTYDHRYTIQCRYNRNGTVETFFIPRHGGLGLAADVPDVVTYFPLNSDYPSQEIEGRTEEGVPTGVELAPGPDGNVGMSSEFSGDSGSFIEIPNTDGGLSVSGSITITLWVRPDAADDTGPLFQYYNETIDETRVSFSIELGALSAQIAPGEPTITDPAPLVIDGWSHVAVSYDGSTGEVTLFVNGVIVVTLTISAGIDLATAFPVFLGSTGSGADHFEGRIARVRLFEEALTEEQVGNVMRFLDAEALQINDIQFNMLLYDADTYAVEDLITSTVPLEDTIYARVSIAHQFGIGLDLFLEKCYATTDQAGDNNEYELINHASCDGINAVEYESTVSYSCFFQTTETEDFSFQAFRYPGQPGIGGADVWLHCEVFACRTDDLLSFCRSQCGECIADRKRRETGKFSDDTKYELTSGPYRFVDNERAQTDPKEEREDHPSFNAKQVVILSVSGSVAVTAIVCVIVLILLRKRWTNVTVAPAVTETSASEMGLENTGCRARDINKKI